MILSLFILALAAVVAVTLLFKFLPQHLSPFLELALPSWATFAFVISPFTAGGFPAFESLCHIAVKLRLALSYQNKYSIASNLAKLKKAAPVDIPDALAILVPRGYANEIAIKQPN